MTLAISTMSAGVQAVFFGIAVVAFVLAAISASTERVRLTGIELVGLGLAFATFVFFWNSLAAS